MTDHEPIASHPTLREFYRSDGDRQRFVNELFDRSSPHYDSAEALLSFGSGAWYRREVLLRAGLEKGMRLLDVATGTGRVASAARRIIGAEGLIVGVDPSRGMLGVARTKVDAHFVQAVGEALAVRSETFDLLVMGYALRHVGDLAAAFREYRRVLRRGGKLVIMEVSVPRSRFLATILRRYMGNITPRLVRFATGSRDTEELMRYYWETTEKCVAPETILAALRASGFVDVRRDLRYGVLSEYHATR